MDGSHRPPPNASPAQPATPRMLRSVSNSMRSSAEQMTKSHSRTSSATRVGSTHQKPEKELLPPASFKPQQPPPPQQSQHSQHSPQQQQQHHLAHKHSLQLLQQQQFHRKSIGDWDFIRTIGAGSMGKVKLARHNGTNEKCAVKIVPRAAKLYQRAHAHDPPLKSAEEAAQRQKEFEKEVARDKRTIREGALGRLLFHPHICRLYEMVPMTNHYYMLFEYVEGGQLLDYIVSHGSLNEKYARRFARGIASALDYCHSNNVVHRDLKIENIMINQKGDIKIIDFGLSNLYKPHSLLKTYCGSLYFAAPELLSAKPYTGPEVDIWSFGVVLYVLVCGKVPFDDPVVSALHERIKKGAVEYPSFISKECVSLLSRMLVVDPAKRATLKEVINHPWMNKGFDFVVPNYLPVRQPLTLPLDPDVINIIASFDLGSASAIAEELTVIITSDEYQTAVETWYRNIKLGRQNYPIGYSAPLDPTSGFHPLVSIYYLVEEMRTRKRAKEEAIKSQIRKQEMEYSEVGKSQLPHPMSPVPPLPSTPQIPQQSSQNMVPQAQTPNRSNSFVHNTGDASKNPFHITSPQKTAGPSSPSQPVPPLQVPEQAHTTTMPSAMSRKARSPVRHTGDETPMQQQASPRNSLNSPETLDPNAGKTLGFNSLFRKLSSKHSKPQSPSPTKSASPNTEDLHRMEGLSPRPVLPPIEISESPNRLSPQSSINSSKHDPMVRRGVSMKVTAKERSTSSRANLETDQAVAQSTRPPKSDDQRYKSHSRSSSSSGKFHGFIPVEYLPPLPNISASQMQGTGVQPIEKPADNVVEKAQLLNAKNYHPTARAKSVGSHARKDSSYYRSGKNQHPALPNAMAFQNSDEGVDAQHDYHDDSYFDDVTLNDVDRPQVPHLTEDQIVEQFNNAKPNSMPSIEYPKTLFLKGFFSVQTTSTKPLPVIRYNIISVLSKLGVKFQEVKGGFVCVHAASAAYAKDDADDDDDAPTANTIIDEYVDDNNSEERRLYGDAFRSSSDSVNNHGVPERSKTPDYQQDMQQVPLIVTPQQTPKHNVSRQPSLHLKTSNLTSPPSGYVKGHRSSHSMSSSHRRKFSIGQSILQNYRKKNGSQSLMPPNTPAAARLNKHLLGGDLDDEDLDDETRAQLQQMTDDDSVDSLNGMMVGGGSDMLVSSRIEQRNHQRSHSTTSEHEEKHSEARKTPLKFEINIVKVPLVGLYGVQFKKTLGNTWNYKTLAGQILNDLNL